MMQDLYLHIQGRINMLISKPIIAFPYLAIVNQQRLFYIYSLHIGYQVNARTGQLTGPNIYLLEWNLKSQVFTQYQITPQQVFEAYTTGYTKFIDLLSSLLPTYLLSTSLRIVSVAYVILNDSVIGYVGNDMSQQSKYYDAAINLITSIKTTYERIHRQEVPTVGPIYTLALASATGTRQLYSPELQMTPASASNLDALTKLVQKYQESALSVGISAYTVAQVTNIPVIVHKVSAYDKSQGMWTQRILPGIPSNIFDLNAISVLDGSFLKELSAHIDQYVSVNSQELYEYANAVLGQGIQVTIQSQYQQNKASQTTPTTSSQSPISQYTIPSIGLNAEIVGLEQKQENGKTVIYLTLRIEQTQTETQQKDTASKTTTDQSTNSAAIKDEQTKTSPDTIQNNQTEQAELNTLETLDEKLLKTLEDKDAGQEGTGDTFDFDKLFG